MKLLVTSVDALIDKTTGDYFPNILKALDRFLKQDEDNDVVVISMHAAALKLIDKKYHPIQLHPKERGSAAIIKRIVEHLEIEYSDMVFLGAKDSDVFTASNAKILLLRAEYAKGNNPGEKIFNKPYGVAIQEPLELAKFFDRYSAIQSPWYYRLQVDVTAIIYALTDANTNYKGTEERILNERFKACLKDGKATFREPFTNYFLVSIYQIFRELNGVNYWEVYPTSDGKPNEDLEYFAMKAREALGNRPSKPLFIRTKPATKRHFIKDPNKRIEQGCSEQFDTIIINPYYRGKLEGKTVCIIDDFTTYGTSCETARHLLEKAGVTKMVFVTMGKFGKQYHEYNYKITGDIYDSYKSTFVSRKPRTGDFNNSANMEFLLTFKGL